MSPWFDLPKILDGKVRLAATAVLGESELQPDIRPADPRFGDFQANGVLPYAKSVRQNPREIASRIIGKLTEDAELNDAVSIDLAGPGFINFRLKPAFLLKWLQTFSTEDDLRSGAGAFYHGKRVVVDFGSPNTAKQMHVGHIRSLVIGEAICRLLAFCGADVVRDNHLGDWGTPYGKIFYAYKRFLDPVALRDDPLEELERLYKQGDLATREDADALEEARGELVKLQAGDPESLALWERINTLTLEALQATYDRLGIHYDVVLGESFYRDKVDQVYHELTARAIAEESDGALVVFHPDHPRFKTQPFIVRKSDGASNYASTDLATMLYRLEHFRADMIIIVTDSRQGDHFEQLELTTRKWFAATGRSMPEFHHVTFGTILGEDGKAIKTRSGDPIRLKTLLNESRDRALQTVRSKSPDLPEAESLEIAEAVGIGAVIYADLSQNRTGDYVFSWDKLLSLEGNTAPYLQYAAARIHSIFRRSGDGLVEDPARASVFDTPEELALAGKIIAFVSIIQQTAASLRPHYLCTYLYELAGLFSSFYNANRVLVDEEDIRQRRLLLCRRVLLILETGLHLLAIRTMKRM
ncbi:MAG: arginine--tRNA ligase [Opitutaceae bacterium]